MMDETNDNGIAVLKSVFGKLKPGGAKMQQNFEDALNNKDYWLALEKIDGNISKGRFAQRLSGELTKKLIPEYIKQGIFTIIDKVKKEYE